MLSDPYSPRPIWDGTSNSIHVVTDKTNAYTDNVCSLSGTYRSTFQTPARRSMTTQRLHADDASARSSTYEAQSQVYAQTVQTTFTSTSDMRIDGAVRLAQGALHRRQVPARQVAGADDQGHRAVAAADHAGRGADLPDAQGRHRVWKTEEQWQTSKSQSVQTTTQYVQQVDQYKLGRKQVYRHQYQTLAKIGDDEIGVPQAGDCTPIPLLVRCEDRGCPSRRFEPSRRPEHLHDRPRCRRSGPRPDT